ncbi:MAG TPA: LemA family protein [Verrucomicrobiae bacterium]|jgi:LemA protein|nr:LemA family protein [Verrucomicrobiae bacterium]
MSTTVVILLAAALILFAGVMWMVNDYNRLVTLRNRFRNGFAQIDVQLKRRYDLIPNLVETARGYLNHERATLDEVMAARQAASAANTRAASNPGEAAAMKELSGAETTLMGTLGRLLAVTEAYPDLKANTVMRTLQEELTSTENKVAYARQAYNDAVMEYNTQRQIFPSSLVADAFHFESAEFFVITTEAEKLAPTVAL